MSAKKPIRFESFRINKTLKHKFITHKRKVRFESFRINKTLKLTTPYSARFLGFESFRINKTLKPCTDETGHERVLNPSVLTRLSNSECINFTVFFVLNPSVLTRLSNLKSGSHRALPSNDRWLLI